MKMKKSKLKVLASLALIGMTGIGLAACGEDSKSTTTTPSATTTTVVPSTPSTTTTVEATVSSISVSGAKTEFKVGDEWSVGNLVVSATMSDGTTKNVTAEATVTHTAVNLNAAGTYTVVVSYSGKTTNYSVTVVAENRVESLIILTDNVKLDYIVGETFDATGVVVKQLWTDSSETEVTNFKYAVYSDAPCTKEVTALTTVGTYYVKFTCGDVSDKIEIKVDTEKYTVSELFNVGTLKEATIVEKTELYDSEVANVSVTATKDKKVTIQKDVKTYFGVSYPNRFKLEGSPLNSETPALVTDPVTGEVTSPRVIKIVAKKDCTIKFVVRSGSSGENRELMLTDLATVNESFIATNDPQMTSWKVKAGTYYVYSASGGINFYGIIFDYDVEASSVVYSNIQVDASALPENYNINQAIDLSGLVVTALNNYNVTDTITDYTVVDKETNKVVTSYTTPGEKTVVIKWNNFEKEVTIKVINPDATVTGIAVQDAADKLVYKQGESFSLNGLTLTVTDSDNLTSTIDSTDTGITYKVFNGDTDVTENFATLTKGTYTVELTYESQTTTYSITMLEERDATWTIPTTIATNANAFESSVTINFTDGTDADYAKYAEVYDSTTANYITKFYSDASKANEVNLADVLTTVGNEFYVELSYGGYTSDVTKVKVTEAVVTELFSASNLVAGTDYKGQELFNGTLFTVTIGSGTVKADSNSSIAEGEMQLKLDSSEGTKSISVTAKVAGTMTFILNASGTKNYTIVDETAAVIKTGTVGKSATDTEVTIIVEAGKTYTIYSVGGGVRVAGVKLEA